MSKDFARMAAGLVLVLAVLAAGIAAELPGAGPDAGKTVLYRDTWGVAHIYAANVEAGMYAMGWAQAEDRPESLLQNLARGIGEAARFEGEEALEGDQITQLWDFYGTAKQGADRIDSNALACVRAFARGVNDFYAAHPKDVPAWWGNRPVDEFMVMAFGSLFLYSWSIDDAIDELKGGGIEPGFDTTPRGSNQWSVSPSRSAEEAVSRSLCGCSARRESPSRSAEKAAILYIDPHLSWWGSSRFWELRIHAGALNGSGVTLAGFPYIGLGHNADVAWAMTTGGPDTSDIYALTLKDDDPMSYRYDNEWRKLTSREVTVTIKDAGTKTLRLLFSHHGPIIAMRGGKAYAAKVAYAGEVGLPEAWFALNHAKDYRDAVAAMDTLQLFPQNVMVADTSGNIYYQRTGRVPKRPDGYNWRRPLDGSTSASEWQGFHAASEHVQILNPPQGYMQNCNITPDVMMVDSPLTPDKYPADVYGAAGGGINERGARALELLSADKSVTVKEALAYAVDVHPYHSERWIAVLKQAHARFGGEHATDADYNAGIKDLLSWNCELRPDSTGALKYYYWRKQLVEDHGDEAVNAVAARITDLMAAMGKPETPVTLSDEELSAAADSFAAAMPRLKQDYGALDAVYGDKFRVGRDDVSWPVGGGGDYGLRTLRSMNYDNERPDHTRWGRGGQTSTQIVVLSKPVRSWMYLPIGESDRPSSTHYRDQAEKCFSPAKLKPTWWMPKDLARHIESRTILEKAS